MHREVARFSDLDPMGHVNNAVYLTWVENARIEFLRALGAFDNPDTTESDLHQPGTEPLMDPSGVKATASEAEMMRRAAERNPD